MKGIAISVGVLVACGGSAHDVRPAPPDPGPLAYDAAPLASAIHAELVDLAAVVVRDEADCKAMAAALKPVFARMQVSIDEAKHVRTDDADAKRLTTELHRYDREAARLTDQITASLAHCQSDVDLREVMVTMPTL